MKKYDRAGDLAGKTKIELGDVQRTLLLPLWGRAVESQKPHPRLVDDKAVEIINEIDYDFSKIAENINPVTQYCWVARSLHTDRIISGFIKSHPCASIVNIGCGLDTTFTRIDNGQITYYNLDLPDVIALRKKFFSGSDREKMIAGSFLDDNWMSRIESNRGVIIIAAGVYYYFTEEQIKSFFHSVAEHFTASVLFFDIASPLGVKVSNKRVLKASGMNGSAVLKWGISSGKEIKKWDRRIRLREEFPMFEGMKSGFPLRMKCALWVSDFLKIMSMVYLKINP